MRQILLVLLSIAYPQLFNSASMLAEEGTKETYVPTNEYIPPLFIEHSSSEEHTLDDQKNKNSSHRVSEQMKSKQDLKQKNDNHRKLAKAEVGKSGKIIKTSKARKGLKHHSKAGKGIKTSKTGKGSKSQSSGKTGKKQKLISTNIPTAMPTPIFLLMCPHLLALYLHVHILLNPQNKVLRPLQLLCYQPFPMISTYSLSPTSSRPTKKQARTCTTKDKRPRCEASAINSPNQAKKCKNLGCNIKICNKRPPKCIALAQMRFAKMR